MPWDANDKVHFNLSPVEFNQMIGIIQQTFAVQTYLINTLMEQAQAQEKVEEPVPEVRRGNSVFPHPVPAPQP